MNRPIISFCIPVFNQVELVKKLVTQILTYKNNDIEIVISDDCSSENIEGMLNEFNDCRVKYYRNKDNLGHDLNIIQTFRRASSNYGFLLRTRDGVVVDNVEKIVEVLRLNPNISYLTGDALDEEGKYRIRYAKEQLIIDPLNCINAHFSLYIHPSGSIYNIGLLNLDAIEALINNTIHNKYGFIAHNLMRLSLALNGQFCILDYPTWVYTNTEKAKDVAVNKLTNGNSVYSSELILQRFITELEWVNYLMNNQKVLFVESLLKLFKLYLYLITWGQKRNNTNPGIKAHYQIVTRKSDIKKDTGALYGILESFLSKSSFSNEELKLLFKKIKKDMFKNNTYGRFRYCCACVLDFLNLMPFFDRLRRMHEKNI